LTPAEDIGAPTDVREDSADCENDGEKTDDSVGRAVSEGWIQTYELASEGLAEDGDGLKIEEGAGTQSDD
jgi:hypothetical protein